jgi:hypothetical protein
MLRLLYESLGAGGLLLVAYIAWSARHRGSLRARHFSVVAAAGSVLLAFDEAFDVHERIGSALYERGWREPAGINHFDDLLVFALGMAGIATAAFFAREILREPRFAALFGAAVALFLAAIAWDSIADPTRTRSWWTEETLELAGVVVMVVAFRERAAWLRSIAGGHVRRGSAVV